MQRMKRLATGRSRKHSSSSARGDGSAREDEAIDAREIRVVQTHRPPIAMSVELGGGGGGGGGSGGQAFATKDVLSMLAEIRAVVDEKTAIVQGSPIVAAATTTTTDDASPASDGNNKVPSLDQPDHILLGAYADASRANVEALIAAAARHLKKKHGAKLEDLHALIGDKDGAKAKDHDGLAHMFSGGSSRSLLEPPATATPVSRGRAVSRRPSLEKAVEAGVVAKGRLASAGYIAHMDSWCVDARLGLPKPVDVQTNRAAIAQLGPLLVEQVNDKLQIEQLEAALKSCTHQTDIADRTKIEHQLNCARQRLVEVTAKFDASLAHLETTMKNAAAGISEGLARDEAAYDAAIRRMATAEPGVLDELSAVAAELNNRGELKPGQEVEVVVGSGDGATLARARIKSGAGGGDGGGAGDGGTYDMSMWKEVGLMHQRYQEGYDTSHPETTKGVARRDIYANRKHGQTLSPIAREAADRRAGLGDEAAANIADKPMSPTFLALLYADAERTLPKLHELGEAISAASSNGGVRAIVAPLKGEERATTKALEKYGGNYAQLTDLARMTFECEKLADALFTLRELQSSDGYEVLLVKDRLMLAFEARGTGGYRDMLLNLRCQLTGHIVEVQITLAPLLAIKAGGGHAAYQLARMHKLFEKATFRHEGALTPRVLECVSCGVIRELICRGKSVGLSKHFEGLLAALSSRSCGLHHLRLVDCDWPKGREMVELACVLPSRLDFLSISTMQIEGKAGPVVGSIASRCPQLTDLRLLGNKLSGEIPPSIGRLVKLKKLLLHGCQFEGKIPAELGACVELEDLQLNNNKLAGEVPPSFGNLVKLKKLMLRNNAKLTIKVPPAIKEALVG